MEDSNFIFIFLIFLVLFNLMVSFLLFSKSFFTKAELMKKSLIIWLIPLLGSLSVLIIILTLNPIAKRKFKKGFQKVAVNDPGGNVSSSDGD